MQDLGAISKKNRIISVRFQGKPFNITVIQVYAPTTNAEEAEVEQFYEDIQDLLELTPQKYIGIKNIKNLNLIKGLYLGGKSKYEKTKKLLKI